MDKELSVIEVNDSTKSICGYTRDAIGKPLSSLQRHCCGICIKAVKECIGKKQPVEVSRVECKNEIRPQQVVTITTHPLLDDNKFFNGVVLVVRDETHLDGLEKQINERTHFYNMVGKSKRMQEIYTLIENLANVQTTVMIIGESGTGKELVAEALHNAGKRSIHALIKVNCSALSEHLLESELFGHARGSFTGAIKERVGRFKLADKGTIFFDEIGDMSHKMQIQLLRVLQERIFEQIGDFHTYQG